MAVYITVKPVNKGYPRERQHIVFIDKWSLFGVYFILSRNAYFSVAFI